MEELVHKVVLSLHSINIKDGPQGTIIILTITLIRRKLVEGANPLDTSPKWTAAASTLA